MPHSYLYFTQSDAADDLISGPEKDPDGDGSTNRMEYAFGGNPNVPEGSPVIFSLVETANPNKFSVEAAFAWADDIADAIWFFEVSNDLENWSEVDVTPVDLSDEGDFTLLVVSFDEPVDVSQRTFLRIGVKESL